MLCAASSTTSASTHTPCSRNCAALLSVQNTTRAPATTWRHKGRPRQQVLRSSAGVQDPVSRLVHACGCSGSNQQARSRLRVFRIQSAGSLTPAGVQDPVLRSAGTVPEVHRCASTGLEGV
eukprot:7571595-Pyramimonas_sp.AAC.2